MSGWPVFRTRLPTPAIDVRRGFHPTDRSALQLLTNEFNKMQEWSNQIIARRKNLEYISPDDLNSDPSTSKSSRAQTRSHRCTPAVSSRTTPPATERHLLASFGSPQLSQPSEIS